MKRDDRALLRFSLAVTGVAAVALLLAAKPARLTARSLPSGSAAHRASVSTRAANSGKAQTAQPAAQKTAGEAYRNVQVLKNIPADQLIPAMRYITAALGVGCEYCHVPKHFDSDDKPHKVTARKMMKMMFAIDQDNFNGERRVTCYTCHRGAAKAETMPVLKSAMMSGCMSGMKGRGGAGMNCCGGMGMQNASQTASAAANAPPLSVDAILAKYTQALGGAAAIQKITTLDAKGTASSPQLHGTNVDVEEIRKAPNAALLTMRLPSGAQMARGFDGTAGWEAFPGRGAEALSGDDLLRAKQWASFIPGLNMKQDFVREQPVGTEKIGDQDAYRVMAFRKGGGRVVFDFDARSGLLLRVSQNIESPLGALPEDTDYSDYRAVNGVKLPFTVTVVRVQGPTVYKWDSIQADVAEEDSRFAQPAQKGAQQQN